ncbi:hypothetical protein KM043_005655 [Ampulex compressa]|nr:hypothetical protein KM043_005655 [Ampulex compressa]
MSKGRESRKEKSLSSSSSSSSPRFTRFSRPEKISRSSAARWEDILEGISVLFSEPTSAFLVPGGGAARRRLNSGRNLRRFEKGIAPVPVGGCFGSLEGREEGGNKRKAAPEAAAKALTSDRGD